MLKLPTLMAVFICFVYSNNEHNVETQLPPSELKPPMNQGERNENVFQTVNGHLVEEKKRTKPCKQNKSRRVDDEGNQDRDLFESLPLSSATEQFNTASVENKIVTTSIHGANYNYKNENNYEKTDNSDKHSKECDCDDCVLEANKKVLQFESLAFENPHNNAAIDFEISEPKSPDSYVTTPDKEASDKFQSSDKNVDTFGSFPLNINSGERTKPCRKGLNLNTRRKNCGTFDLSGSKPLTRRILPGIIENPTSQELEDNRLYQDSPQLNTNNDIDPETRQNYFPNVQKVTNTYGIDLVHNMNINEGSQSQQQPGEDSVENQLTEPTKGKGIYDMKDTGVMLLENSRVCYACTTITDPTCWSPDRRTTVKYCRKGHKSCLTKSFKHNGKSVVIRDCGSHCVDLPGSEEKYRSCSICHSDLCNGATSMKMYSTGIAIIAFLGILLNTH